MLVWEGRYMLSACKIACLCDPAYFREDLREIALGFRFLSPNLICDFRKSMSGSTVACRDQQGMKRNGQR
ncbi:hypothetical protein NECAME_18296 [Necator americanus]|uniref:Uncharacterized protein n=1 Tax=Necator americanus TaxID=51031 RepID=W2SUS2_NECAM|nr:hypothetical protein NECAME_18296 [Necator americanus]ETN73494.1 hypothetical protein NECAME_18296 [Necator americanus]